MAHPKRKISKPEETKEELTMLTAPGLAQCPTTGEFHLPHRAYWLDGKLYLKDRLSWRRKFLLI